MSGRNRRYFFGAEGVAVDTNIVDRALEVAGRLLGVCSDEKIVVVDLDGTGSLGGYIVFAIHVQTNLGTIIRAGDMMPLAIVNTYGSKQTAHKCPGHERTGTGELYRARGSVSLQPPGTIALRDYGLPFAVELIDLNPCRHGDLSGQIEAQIVAQIHIVTVAVELQGITGRAIDPCRIAGDCTEQIVAARIGCRVAGALIEFPEADKTAGTESPDVPGYDGTIRLNFIDAPVISRSAFESRRNS